MEKLFRIIIVISLCAGMQTAEAQKISIENVRKVSLRKSGVIIADEQIKGYYSLFMSDKVDRKTNEYTLQILDANLNKQKEIKFTDSKDITLLESSYNGSSLVFLFYNEDEKTLDYRLFNLDGTKTFSYNRELDKRSNEYFKLVLEQNGGEETENQTIFDIKSKGFVAITPLKENKKYTYEVNFYASDKRKSWTFNPIEDGKFALAQYLGSNDSIAIIEVLSRDKLLSKEMESTLVGINLTTGRKVFESRTQDGKYQLYPMNVGISKGTNDFVIIGPYYEGSDRVMQDKSTGIGVWQMDMNGKIIKSKYNSFQKDIAKYVNVNSKGQISDIGYVFFHNIFQTEDGNYFAIGEGYKKAASAAGIALSVLSGSYSGNTTKLVVTDMIMLQMNSNFDMVSAKIYPKNNNNFNLQGADFANAHTLALIAKNYGAFDYSYTQLGKNKSSFVTAYTDYERGKDYKGLTFNSISYVNGKITNDKINLSTKATSMMVLPAKPGSVVIMEYFKKDKRVDVRMEKIN